MRVALYCVLAVVLGVQVAAAAGRPNVVLIMADDMGYETVGANGGISYQTPEFDRLARDGVRFTQMYAQPLCTPSRVKLMTGRSNWRNYDAFGVLRPDETTVAQVLKKAGYKTCVAGKWQLSGGAPESATWGWGVTPERAGFDEHLLWAYSHYLSEKSLKHYRETSGVEGQTSRFWNPSIIRNGKYVPTTAEDYGPDLYTDFLIDFIERNQEGPFFAYFPMALTHSPFVATPHSEDKSREAKFKSQDRFFGDMVEYTDFLVGRIRNKIDELGIAEKTLFIFITDNGSGRGLRSEMKDRVVIGDKGHPTDAGTRAPMFVWWKGVTKPGMVTDALVEMSDFLPTLAEACDAPLPEDVEIDGRTILPLLTGKAYRPRDWIFIHYDRDPNQQKSRWPRARFVRNQRYKLYEDGRFFDVPSDWDEEQPLEPGTLSDDAEQARKMLQKVLDATPPPRFAVWAK